LTRHLQGKGTLREDMNTVSVDQSMMARCIELSQIGASAGELPIGSLVACDGKIIAEATNEIERSLDESRHAEIIAIARARKLLGDDQFSKCTLYSTLEPCVMCSFCIRTAGVGRVVFALGSPQLGGVSRWNVLGDDTFPFVLGPVPEVVRGVLTKEARNVWIGLHPIIGRATWLFGFLDDPPRNTVEKLAARRRLRYSLRRLVSLFLNQPRKRALSRRGNSEAPTEPST
jgi:tRNA(adenine34) deaminase